MLTQYKIENIESQNTQKDQQIYNLSNKNQELIGLFINSLI